MDAIKAIIIAERQADAHLTLQAIGDRVHRSREYVRQVLVEAGQPTTATLICRYHCTLCGAPRKRQNKYCGDCLARIRLKVLLQCSFCGREIIRNAAQVAYRSNVQHYKHWFCDRDCWAGWLRNRAGNKEVNHVEKTLVASHARRGLKRDIISEVKYNAQPKEGVLKPA